MTPGAEKLSVTIGSPQLGLPKGSLTDLDATVAQLNREQLALRTVAVLTGLFADIDNGMVNVSKSLAGGLGGESGATISAALTKDNALFVEPLQQLVLLRRCLTVAKDDASNEWSEENLKRYFDACRYAADVSSLDAAERLERKDAKDTDLPETALIVAASFLLRMSLLNQPHPTQWIARMRLMLRELPQQDPRAKPWTERLTDRILTAFGITFDTVAHFVAMLTLWSLRFKSVDDVFNTSTDVALNLDTWLSQTNVARDDLLTFFSRTARRTDEVLSDEALGGPISILPFRDRPFIQFANGGVAPVYRPWLPRSSRTISFGGLALRRRSKSALGSETGAIWSNFI